MTKSSNNRKKVIKKKNYKDSDTIFTKISNTSLNLKSDYKK